MADMSEERRVSTNDRLSMEPDGKHKPGGQRRTAWALTPAEEDACVFREDDQATMFANSEAFLKAKENFVSLIGRVEPVADRVAQEREEPRAEPSGHLARGS